MRISPLKHLARAGRSGVLAVCMATALSLAAPIGTAQAATTPSPTKAASTGQATTPAKSSTSDSSSKSASSPSTLTSSSTSTKSSATKATQPATKPTAPVKAKLTSTLPAAQARAARASAARAAVRDAVADTCSGQISPDTVYPCSTPSSTGTDTFTVTVPDATDVLVIQALSTSGNTLGYTVTAPGGGTVTCQNGCSTAAAGTYTLQVQNQSSAYSLDYTALLSDTTCAAANPSFATPVLQGSVTAGEVGACYTLAMTSGHVLHAYVAGTTWGEMNVAVYDSTGTRVCVDDQGDCTLTGTAPYRVLVSDLYGRANTYYTTLYDVTDPQGCLTVAQQTYGTVPDQSSSIQCRTLDVATAGSYQIAGVNAGGSLYNPDGTAACTNSGATCQLAAGTYDFVTLEYPEDITPLGVVFIAANETRGCTASGDTDFASGPATGTFAGLGEEFCLTLPTATGKSVYVFNQPTAQNANVAQAQILDATGTQQCPSANFADATCALTGTAPFHAILSASAANGGFRFLVQRTDSTAGCTVWPQSGFGGSAGLTETITPVSDVACMSIPANQHSTGEMIDYADKSNTENGGIDVNDPTGKQVCLDLTTTICSYTPGVAYTALLSSTIGDTYQLVRRDVSQSATCSTPASTAVGGPSTSYTLTSDLYAVCERVTAAAADKMYFGVRTQSPSPASAALEVTDPSGKYLCRQWGIPCELTGSSSYQVIVIASGYAGVSIAAHVDSWIVGTASGWASQCTAHQLSSNGWAPVGGTLTESSTAYCAVVTPVSGEQFAVYGAASANGGPVPYVTTTSAANWGASVQLCSGSDGFVYCQTSNLGSTPAVMLVVPGESTSVSLPIPYQLQGVCQLSCPTHPAPPTISSITPSTGAAGRHQIVVNGSNLNLGTTLQLDSNGVPSGVYGSPLSVNAAGTALTMLIDTTYLTPGTYDADLDGAGYATGTPSQGYLPGAYKVTAAPTVVTSRFVPLNTVRILDTRTGLGAPKARVGQGGQVTLKVAGVGGVPASGVSAVLLNVTAVNPVAGGNLEVYPDSETRPGTSTLNFGKGETVANLAVVPLVDGKVDLVNNAPGLVDILADVSGYYTTSSTSGSLLTTVPATRILDTRTGLGAAKAKVPSNGTVKLNVLGVAGLPASGVTAVLVNVTAIAPTASGNLEVYPDSLTPPGTSTLNFVAGQTVSNQAYVRVIDGKIDVLNNTPGQTDITLDVLGYFSATGSTFRPENTVRVLDTRTGLGGSGETVVPGGAAVLNVMNLPGVPNTVTAVVLNVTVTSTQQAGYLTVYPDGSPRPSVPTYSYTANGTIAGLVTVPVVNGQVDFYNGSAGTIQVIADLAGYYGS